MNARMTMLLGCFLAAAALGCDPPGRFPVCKADTDCADKEVEGHKTALCYDLRCVQCRSDDDCPADNACNTSKECKALGGAGAPIKPEAADAGHPPMEADQPMPSASATAGPAGSAAPKAPKGKH